MPVVNPVPNESAATSKGLIDLRAVAEIEGGKKLEGRIVRKGSLYDTSALLAADAALLILGKEGFVTRGLRGGLLTPATLGNAFVERLRDAGFSIEVNLVWTDGMMIRQGKEKCECCEYFLR